MTDPKPCILIIDDEKVTSRTMAMALEAVGYETIESATGEEGIGIALGRKPDLIMLDYIMPEMDGIEVLRKLRKSKDDWARQVPVIVASNVYNVDIINSMIELGVQDYVLKVDVNLDEIVQLVGKYIPAPIPSPPSLDGQQG